MVPNKCPYHCDIEEKINTALELKKAVENLEVAIKVLNETTITQKAFYDSLNDIKNSICECRDIQKDAKNKYGLLIFVLSIALASLGVNILNLFGL